MSSPETLALSFRVRCSGSTALTLFWETISASRRARPKNCASCVATRTLRGPEIPAVVARDHLILWELRSLVTSLTFEPEPRSMRCLRTEQGEQRVRRLQGLQYTFAVAAAIAFISAPKSFPSLPISWYGLLESSR